MALQGQPAPQPLTDITGEPKEVVTLMVMQPPTAIHSHYQDLLKKVAPPSFTSKTAKERSEKFHQSRKNMGKILTV